jgi:hypothetical protein
MFLELAAKHRECTMLENNAGENRRGHCLGQRSSTHDQAIGFGGVIGEMAVIRNYDSATQAEEAAAKLLADREYVTAIGKATGLLLPGSAATTVWCETSVSIAAVPPIVVRASTARIRSFFMARTLL